MDEARLLGIFKKYAGLRGYLLTSDHEHLQYLIKGQLINEARYGYRYCTCKVRTGDKVKDARVICPCSTHREEIEETGQCWCGLFFKNHDG